MVVVAALWVGYTLWSGKSARDNAKRPQETIIQPVSRQIEVGLYFSDDQAEYLVAEKRKIPWNDRPADRVRAVLEALIKGPQSRLQPTIPEGTRVREVSVEDNGICSVDFTEVIVRNHPGGTSNELMTVYSIVESLTENVPEVQSVRILVEGRPRETLAGHLFIGEPLQPEPRYVRKRSS